MLRYYSEQNRSLTELKKKNEDKRLLIKEINQSILQTEESILKIKEHITELEKQYKQMNK